MGHEPDDLDRRLSRCERALFGDDDSSEGISARMKVAETTLANLDSTLKRINWLLIAGILTGLLNLVIRPIGSGPTSNQNSVNLGSTRADGTELVATTARSYLTTTDLAEKEHVSERTVTDWINQGRIEPSPTKSGKSWIIARNFRILPNPADECGKTPQ